uniref:glycosyltransferase n=1 Tax=Clostridium sp. NkU-1 TaxID=1095009 RepID=UPI0006CF66FB
MKLWRLIEKFRRVWREGGLLIAIKRVFHFIGNLKGRKIRREDIRNVKKNKGTILFINGCCVENPIRYRVLHQMEQLKEAGISCAKIYSEDIELEMEKNYQLFIFYRCEYTENIAEFIGRAKSHQKRVCFDIDDLITDTKYTNQLPFVQEFSLAYKKVFDTSVMLIGKTLSLCDIAIVTTEALAEELGKVVQETYINRNTASKEMVIYAEEALKSPKYDSKYIWLGYFSGSLTHNKDFEIIRPVLMRILEEYTQIGLILVGELETSDEINRFGERIMKMGMTSWQELPKLIVRADVNLAPLEDTIFNRSKSEIKWIEAALVKVPTVASNIGAFKTMIEDGMTGILCENIEDSWYKGICRIIDDKTERLRIAENAYKYVMSNCTTIGKCQEYADFIQSQMLRSNNRIDEML